MGEADRRLAGILAADVVGYSAMVGADEPATLARVRALRTDIVEPLAAAHGGRLFKTTGDGFFAAFASAVQALRCAIAIQDRLRAQSDGLRLRIGVHQGEVVPDGGDLLGDGVIIAARLEPLAEPGGICISAREREDAAGKVTLEVEDLGTPELKNVAARIQVFRVRLGLAERPRVLSPGKPSIAVLAFNNMGGDPEQEYFSDGIAEDIITELSRCRWLFVIARNSSFTYKGHAVDLKRVARELGVRYVLEGSVRRGGQRVRVSAQLIDAETGAHVWAERYDRDLADVFVVQDEITSAVTRAIQPAISHAERQRAIRKAPENLDAWEAYQRGLWHLAKGTEADTKRAQSYLRRAAELDELFAAPHVMLAFIHLSIFGLATAFSVQQDFDAAEAEARRAIELEPDDSGALAGLASVYTSFGRYEAAIEAAEQAIAAGPNDVLAYLAKSRALAFMGRSDEAQEPLLIAQRLSPRDPLRAFVLLTSALAWYFSRRYDEAVRAAQLAIRDYPQYPLAYRWLAASLGQLGRVEEAGCALRQAQAVSAASFNFHVLTKPPWFRPEDHEHMLDGLRKAGWQD